MDMQGYLCTRNLTRTRSGRRLSRHIYFYFIYHGSCSAAVACIVYADILIDMFPELPPRQSIAKEYVFNMAAFVYNARTTRGL